MVWTRNYPVVIGSGVALVLFGLVGATALTRGLPQNLAAYNPHLTPMLESTASAAAARKSDCRACGVVAAVRPIEIRESAESGVKERVFRIVVRMDDGTERALTQPRAPLFGVGSRVRVKGNALEGG
ncbi:MAG: hypothetical protein JO035_04365 [Betaproteobacteria bacterium]|nr:hypothetical protein [Betaproteobacteria bacterium]